MPGEYLAGSTVSTDPMTWTLVLVLRGSRIERADGRSTISSKNRPPSERVDGLPRVGCLGDYKWRGGGGGGGGRGEVVSHVAIVRRVSTRESRMSEEFGGEQFFFFFIHPPDKRHEPLVTARPPGGGEGGAGGGEGGKGPRPT